MLARLNRVLLGGQAEGVEAHRVHDGLALHAGRAGDDVGGRVALGMADVEAVAAGVGEHVERVELAAGAGHFGRGKGLVVVPVLLPLGLDGGGVVAGHGEEDRDVGYGDREKRGFRVRGSDSTTLATAAYSRR